MPLTLPIQIGKKYVCRDGAVITAQRCGFLDVAAFVNEKSVFPESGSVWVWLSNGRHYNENETHNNDLVADYIEPAVETVGHIHAALMALFAASSA